MKTAYWLSLGILFALVAPLGASAVSFSFTGDSLHGATGKLTIVDHGSTSTVTWSLDTTGFDDAGAIATGHTLLTDVAFKISGMTSVTLAPSLVTVGDLYYPSNIHSGANGCDTTGSMAGFACLVPADPVQATVDQEVSYLFVVGGDLDLSEPVSFRGKYGPSRGWVISEQASAPVPEPSAALLFLAGILVVGRRSI